MKKFGDFITEIKASERKIPRLDTGLSILDAIIDEDGKLVDETGYIRNVKRNGEMRQVIVDKSWDIDDENKDHEYIGGIDKNGFLIGFFWNKNTLLNSEKKVVKNSNGKKWKRNGDRKITNDDTAWVPEYPELVGLESSGWVNVKIDMEVIRKIKKFSKILGDGTGVETLRSNLKKLTNPTGIRGRNSDTFTQVIQQKIAAVTLLRHVKEMKDYFNVSSAGFLFESFIAGLIDGYVPDDNKYADVIGKGKSGRDTYQIKFLDYAKDKGTIKLTKLNTKRLLLDGDTQQLSRYYVVALKSNSKIYINILQTKNNNRKDSLINFLTDVGGFSFAKLRKYDGAYVLDLTDLDADIEKIGNELKETLNDIWQNISTLEYNVETITTGVNKERKIISSEDYDQIYVDSSELLKTIDEDLSKLKGNMEE